MLTLLSAIYMYMYITKTSVFIIPACMYILLSITHCFEEPKIKSRSCRAAEVWFVTATASSSSLLHASRRRIRSPIVVTPRRTNS